MFVIARTYDVLLPCSRHGALSSPSDCQARIFKEPATRYSANVSS
ncbi:hypothetical protein ANDA3_4431 [plant metagenome]|uniref:Uncharacterized protein n=2 Tax=root TaxID=1 RepID=A0A1C3K5N9_9BURK|nr:hypothetical protein ODI_00899 [Orrella dioscoreae]SOE52373.1 hypothetical protein ODI_R4121 [Orrella dioscoreae]